MNPKAQPREVSQCPPENVLQQLTTGVLEPELAESVAQHLDSCPRCCDAIEAVSDEIDSFLADLRQPEASFRYRREDAFALLQSRACQIVKDISETLNNALSETLLQSDPTLGAGSSRDSPHSEAIGFLRPAQRDDELGRLGGYRILQVLGSGGMGVVFHAEDPQLKRSIALKVMKPSASNTEGAKPILVGSASGCRNRS
ncbi:MAG: hypothetical protein R3C05_29785 [Pirellulaceae bacterium]